MREFLEQKVCMLHAEARACSSRYGFSAIDGTARSYHKLSSPPVSTQ